MNLEKQYVLLQKSSKSAYFVLVVESVISLRENLNINNSFY